MSIPNQGSLRRRITLHSYRRCPFAIRVRMTLHEKNIPFETIEEDLKNFSPELKEKHPEAKVPVLIDGNLVLYESSIITEYLDEAYPGPQLVPTDAKQKATMRIWTYWCNQIFKPNLDKVKYGPVKLKAAELKKADEDLRSNLEKLEKQLSQRPWILGSNFSLADIHLFPFYRQITRMSPAFPGLENYPALRKWLEKITSRPSFKKTMVKLSKREENGETRKNTEK